MTFMTTNITKLCLGDIYEPKFATQVPLKIQVGRGGDCGVYVIYKDNDTYLFMFRVLVNTASIKKDWNLVERGAKAADELLSPAPYGESDIGTKRLFRVYLDDVEKRYSISLAEFNSIERLASYSTANIMSRVYDELGISM